MSNNQLRPNVWTRTGPLAIAGALTALVAFVLGIVPVLGTLVAIAAFVLGILALRRHQSTLLSIIALGGGLWALMASIVVTVSRFTHSGG